MSFWFCVHFLYGQGYWAFFHVFIGYLYSFWESSFSFTNLFIGLLIHWEFSFLSSLYILVINPDLLPSVGWLFILCFLCCAGAFQFDAVSLVNFFSYLMSYWRSIQEVIILACVFKCFLIFSCSSFKSLGLTLRYLILYELTDTGWKTGILFQCSVCDYPASQHHVLKRLSFLLGIFLAPLSKIKWL
jgi:hypothetical protein